LGFGDEIEEGAEESSGGSGGVEPDEESESGQYRSTRPPPLIPTARGN